MNTANCPHCGNSLIKILKAANPPMQDATKSGANVARAILSPPDEPELKLVTCNRCGEENLCWQKSKNDKFYLCRTRIEGDKIMPLRKEFHVSAAERAAQRIERPITGYRMPNSSARHPVAGRSGIQQPLPEYQKAGGGYLRSSISAVARVLRPPLPLVE